MRVEKFRHDDGGVVEREVVEHPGASVMLPLDGDRIWLVRQPREVVGEELLELPAGKLNGGDPWTPRSASCAKRSASPRPAGST